jgi:hypothetical protein
MYCNIQGKSVEEIIKHWSVLIDISPGKIMQFYILNDSLEKFNLYYSLLSAKLNLIDNGEFLLRPESSSLYQEIRSKLPLTAQNYSFAVKNFNDSWNAKPEENKNSYNGWRFGHDYDQELMESRALKKALNDFEGKIVIFTWVDDTNPKITRTAMASQFKSGAIAIKPVEK